MPAFLALAPVPVLTTNKALLALLALRAQASDPVLSSRLPSTPLPVLDNGAAVALALALALASMGCHTLLIPIGFHLAKAFLLVRRAHGTASAIRPLGLMDLPAGLTDPLVLPACLFKVCEEHHSQM